MVNDHGRAMPELNWNKFNPFDQLQQGQSFSAGLPAGMPELMNSYKPTGIDKAVVDGQLRPEWRQTIKVANYLAPLRTQLSVDYRLVDARRLVTVHQFGHAGG